MPVEFTDALAARLTAVAPNGVSVAELFKGDLPAITYQVGYSPAGGNSRFQVVTVDLDIWTVGPSPVHAETIAAELEAALLDWGTQTDHQGQVRLTSLSRATEPEPDEKLARITMRLTGRCFRRLN